MNSIVIHFIIFVSIFGAVLFGMFLRGILPEQHLSAGNIVFTDLSADRAKDLFDDVLQHLGVPSYVEDGLVLGGFYESNEVSAI